MALTQKTMLKMTRMNMMMILPATRFTILAHLSWSSGPAFWDRLMATDEMEDAYDFLRQGEIAENS